MYKKPQILYIYCTLKQKIKSMNFNPSLPYNDLPHLPFRSDIDTVRILKKLASAHRFLGELKGEAKTIPDENILINTLVLQEAKDSSAIENIITTHDELYKSGVIDNSFVDPAAKEVQRYAAALKKGLMLIAKDKLLTMNNIIEIQQEIEMNSAGFRRLPGTTLKNLKNGEVIYTPPAGYDNIMRLMENLVRYINDHELHNADPLIKMALIHYQFESIHPFYDGNGRTGRIINVLYLILNDLLDLPVLYMSRYIIKNKSRYYELLQEVKKTESYEEWILFMLESVESTAKETVIIIRKIKRLFESISEKIEAELPNIYSRELVNNLFYHPYTKIEFLCRDLNITRITAQKYLSMLVDAGILTRNKLGRSYYFVNKELFGLFAGME